MDNLPSMNPPRIDERDAPLPSRPCLACGHTWPAHRDEGTGACSTERAGRKCPCPAYWDPQRGSLRSLTDRLLKNPASRPVRGSVGRGAGQP